ncbi:hypothetical protein [Streptomyces alboniger]|uniref:Uncharacterized protein n=1 Tax=Streptomyces alboniger TaxID=132473 RepID=A0A5J6HIX9_STRAD|nr:hypothetical protein [Streptomyces alboniger]QEV20176.1 hypothetical protein CP975_23950 [Streptomyces alboniger]
MGSEGPRSGAGPQEEPVCGACGEPVGTVIRRRKVLGVFVPVWRPGPCRNALCEACVGAEAEEARPAGRISGRHFRSRHRRKSPAALPDPGGRGASKAGPAGPADPASTRQAPADDDAE